MRDLAGAVEREVEPVRTMSGIGREDCVSGIHRRGESVRGVRLVGV